MKSTKTNSASVIDSCIRHLRGAIMIGDLRPGQKLIEADLSQMLGVSRASVREALRMLKAERLVELIPNRGPSVAKLGAREIEDIHDVWALLTGETVHRFAQRAQPREISRLGRIAAQLKRALGGGNPLEQLNVTNSFFGMISQHCGNDILIDAITSLVSRINFLRAQALNHEGWRELCAQEIEAIVLAIRAKKPSVARQAAWRHINSACRAANDVSLLSKPMASKEKNQKASRPFTYSAAVTRRHGLRQE